jgi:hypothetical protein
LTFLLMVFRIEFVRDKGGLLIRTLHVMKQAAHLSGIVDHLKVAFDHQHNHA